MILASDLRIGNWVYFSNEYDLVSGVFENSVVIKYRSYSPVLINSIKEIEFTNEWLDRFGFEKRDNSNWWHKGNFTYWQDQNTWYWRMEPIHPDLTMYVHQIQNLYHALTGEEL
jgi:hypothetical protein